jgi:Transposase DDE domain
MAEKRIAMNSFEVSNLKTNCNPMFDVNVKLICELKEFVSIVASDIDLLGHFRCSPKDFVRSRKLPFDRLVLLIAKLCKKTLSVELEDFFTQSGETQCCSVSAFVQQRIKLKPLFFAFWNKFLCSTWYECNKDAVKRWKGYRIVAADGSNATLVNNPALSKHFGGQSNQQSFFTIAKTLYYYDVLNELILLPRISPYRDGELNMVYDMIDRTEEDMLLIYDRNFSNYKVLALHLWQEKERKFIIRAKDTLCIVRDFIASGKASVIVYWPPTVSAIQGLKKSHYLIDKNTLLKVRLVRVELAESTEVLITNLWEDQGHPVSQFKELYFMRWGIETNISLQKNVMQLESFSGLSVAAVEQDFYATVFMANLHSALIKDAQQTVEADGVKRKYPVKINKNKSFGKLKMNFVHLFLTQQPASILKILHDFFKKELIPIRKGRTFERVRKNPQSKSKYKTFTNFKPAY